LYYSGPYNNLIHLGVIADPVVGTNIVCGVNVLATMLAFAFMGVSGRRILLIFSGTAQLLSTVVIVLALLGYIENWVTLIAVNAFVFFFELGVGPIPWLIVAEYFETEYVAIAMSAACVVNWTCNFCVGLLFPVMNQDLGPYSFAPFGIILLILILMTLTVLPESKGRTPAEIMASMR
jgi:SP family facilitated glucose transporter-like MFS transporter 3